MPAANVTYQHGDAHSIPLPNNSADLVTAASALHWFDLPAFYKEVRRVLKPHGCLAAWAIPLVRLAWGARMLLRLLKLIYGVVPASWLKTARRLSHALAQHTVLRWRSHQWQLACHAMPWHALQAFKICQTVIQAAGCWAHCMQGSARLEVPAAPMAAAHCQAALHWLHEETLGDFWDRRKRLCDDMYKGDHFRARSHLHHGSSMACCRFMLRDHSEHRHPARTDGLHMC